MSNKALEAGGAGSEESPATPARRAFVIGAACSLVSLIGAAVGTARFMVPTVSLEPPSQFKLGYPEEFDDDTVTFDEHHRIYVVRDRDGLYVMSAICTHLGCTTRWDGEQNVAFCPCHGSKFRQDGANITGPAPKPLRRYLVTLAEDGRILVDTDQTIGPEEWPKSILAL